MADRSGAPGPGINRVVRAGTRSRGILTCHSQEKYKVKPEFSTSYRPYNILDHMQRQCGEQSRRENRRPMSRLRTATLDPHIPEATDRVRDIRGSPSCTGVGVVKLGRGGPFIGLSRPRPIGIRASPPGSGVVPFSFEKPSDANQSANELLRSFLFAAWTLQEDPDPYVSGIVVDSDRNNHAYGISCRMRPISVGRNRVRRRETGTAWAVLNARTNELEADGLGQKSGLVLGGRLPF